MLQLKLIKKKFHYRDEKRSLFVNINDFKKREYKIHVYHVKENSINKKKYSTIDI